MKLIFFLLLNSVVICFSSAFSQVKAIDKLEILYDQGHYKMVYNRANRLLDKPDYDYSYQPEFYKSLAMFRLTEHAFWNQLHPDALQQARKLFLEVKSAPDGLKVFNAHLNHVADLKKNLTERAIQLKKDKKQFEFDEMQQLLFGLFDHIPELDNPADILPPVAVQDGENELSESSDIRKERDNIVSFAKKYLGIPYKYAGDDPAGFDCSGFSTFVMNEFKKELPRRAEDQYKESVKVKQRNATKGDLIFFNSGSGVSHVGILISEKGAPLEMIHSSSSKGIVITNIEESEYWLKRIYAFGTYVGK